MKWIVLLAAVPSFVIAVIAVPLVRRLAARTDFVDRPGARKVHHEPVPLGGGLAIYVAVLLPFLAGTVALIALEGADPQTASSLLGEGALAKFVVPHLPGMTEQLGNLWFLLGAATAMMVLGPEAGFKLARRLGTAALFVLNDSGSFQEIATPAFAKFDLA